MGLFIMRLLRKSDVEKKVGLKQTTISLMVARGEFPKPMKISQRIIAWLESDIDEWIQAKVGKDNGKCGE